MRILRIVFILSLIAAVPSCRKLKEKQEEQAKDYCADTAGRVCARYFSCHPVAAAQGFDTETDCALDMTDACTNSMKVCGITQDELKSCYDGLGGTQTCGAGSWPDACVEFAQCWVDLAIAANQ